MFRKRIRLCIKHRDEIRKDGYLAPIKIVDNDECEYCS